MMRRLGKGLADIIDTAQPGAPAEQAAEGGLVTLLPVSRIRPGRFQPRTTIDAAALEELKQSIKRSGVIEPIVVRPAADGAYELVAGERRLRASQGLGLEQIPAIIKTLSDQEALELSIVENIQREALNPLEEAQAYARLLHEFHYTQEEIAGSVGKDRATVANLLRLLALPEEIRAGVGKGAITLGHAKVLLSVEDGGRQAQLYQRILREALSVRQAEQAAGSARAGRRKPLSGLDPQMKGLEDELRRALGTKVRLMPTRRGGRILIDYFSSEDLSRILQALTGPSHGG